MITLSIDSVRKCLQHSVVDGRLHIDAVRTYLQFFVDGRPGSLSSKWKACARLTIGLLIICFFHINSVSVLIPIDS